MVKMRTNQNPTAVCCECGDTQNQVLGMFDVKLGNKLITICDRCNEELFNKTLKASCKINEKIKDKHDMKIIKLRRKGRS